MKNQACCCSRWVFWNKTNNNSAKNPELVLTPKDSLNIDTIHFVPVKIRDGSDVWNTLLRDKLWSVLEKDKMSAI